MALFVWQEIYSVGVDQIDRQHQKLFEIGNRFHDAFAQREARPALAAIFNELVEYTVYHFTDEERLMQEWGYPDFARHKANHEKLVGLVLGYKRQLESGAPDVEPHAMNFIKTWLNGHVLGMDRNYCGYANRQPSGAGTTAGSVVR
jgi:hemerythrin-like metal-binding protein